MGRHEFFLTSVLIMIYACVHTNGQCDDGWMHFRDSCYLFAQNKKTNFVNAEDYCRQHGGYLVHPNSAIENNFLKNMVQAFAKNYWIGITDETSEGTWYYYGTNEIIQFSDWYPGQPDSHKGNDEDCAMYHSDHGLHWHDYGCTTDVAEPLCEKTMSSVLQVVG